MAGTTDAGRARELLIEARGPSATAGHIRAGQDERVVTIRYALRAIEAALALPPNDSLIEALKSIAYLRPAGDVDRIPSTKARDLVGRMERIALNAIDAALDPRRKPHSHPPGVDPPGAVEPSPWRDAVTDQNQPAIPGVGGERERIARIIDPEAWCDARAACCHWHEARELSLVKAVKILVSLTESTDG